MTHLDWLHHYALARRSQANAVGDFLARWPRYVAALARHGVAVLREHRPPAKPTTMARC